MPTSIFKRFLHPILAAGFNAEKAKSLNQPRGAP